MTPLVVSIPHTGTRFLISLMDTTNYYHVHAEGTWERVKQAGLVITPIRSPENNWRSWWRRHHYSQVVCPKCGPQVAPNDEFWGCWMLMDKYDREREILYVRVDVPEKRDGDLARVSAAIGRELVTSWAPVGHDDEGSDGVDAPAVDLAALYRYDFVRRLYGNQH